uniref:Uncharacterized protein n=1 Tax=Anguilla anguilla TaxID=7936 RepID=A0A0E9TFE7_ANGAN
MECVLFHSPMNYLKQKRYRQCLRAGS